MDDVLNNYMSDLVAKHCLEIIRIQRLTNDMTDNTVSDEVIALAVDRALKCILKYTGWKEFDINYQSALITLAITYLNNDKIIYSSARGERITKSITQGARSESYESNTMKLDSYGLTESVRAMLPYPKIKVI